MKKLFKTAAILLSAIFLLSACSSSVETRLTFKNLATNKVNINFRAQIITVKSGETVVLKDVPKGTFDYSTTYELPVGTVSSTTDGAVSGTLDFKAGVEYLIVYSSTFINDIYTLSATISSSKDQSAPDDGNPLGP